MCQSRLPRPYIRRRSSDFMISPFSSRFEMSPSASLPSRFFWIALMPIFVWSSPSSRWAKSSCSASVNGWSRKTRTAYSSMPAADLGEGVRVVDVTEVDRADLGDEVRVKLAECQGHDSLPPRI